MKELTQKQQAVYDFIVEYQENNDKAPTFKQIGAAVGMKPETAQFHAYALERKRKLYREKIDRFIIN